MAERWRVFVASGAGDRHQGQVWCYVPVGDQHGRLTLVYESPRAKTLNQPDAIVGGANGVVVMAEATAATPAASTSCAC